ncbi:response regulator [Citreimonas sp.]|uniref:response regulator n=1 Tax=Citreimonas sp. TaxID=3036715 RepID=UPI00405874B3
MSNLNEGLSDRLARHLPFLRRYARALTGTQSSGDAYAVATLEAVLQDRSVLKEGLEPRVALFRAFHMIWTSAGTPVEASDTTLERAAQNHLNHLTPNSREALLLNTIESFTTHEIGQIMDISTDEAREIIDIAHHEMHDSVSGKVLVIEDEAIIAMDIRAIVTSMGHHVTGVGQTHRKAVELGLQDYPDLILADIQLADNSSGIDAVKELLETVGNIPVIFITAFPERLLTGDRPEPAFIIPKPYSERQVKSAVSQAMFFSSTETLSA